MDDDLGGTSGLGESSPEEESDSVRVSNSILASHSAAGTWALDLPGRNLARDPGVFDGVTRVAEAVAYGWWNGAAWASDIGGGTDGLDLEGELPEL
jgi:hypothetical protein